MPDQPLEEVDPEISRLIDFERARQRDKLQMIPSESLCPAPVLAALATPFSNKYAEGYPSTRMSRRERHLLPDFDRYLAFHRRYGDRRYYKGTEFADFAEALAQKRCAELFTSEKAAAKEIFVNVQPLSGAAANNAVYDAFLQPGDRILGMHLSYGGHLTHGSPFNRSGRYFKGAAYTTGEDGKLDFDAIRRQAREHRPHILVAGASAYPWTIDWEKLRAIADEAGALLLADVSHPAGLIAGGQFPNPVGTAHVTMFTTHKTLCGPRGATLVSTDPDIARKLDTSVFPGEQGGPHVNQIAAKAVAFGLAAKPEFRALMRRIVENMASFVDELGSLGLPLAFGGSNTHLCLVDLRGMKWASGVPLTADVATNILDLCGITCNKNALPGDATGVRPSGIRFGSVVLSQRGFGDAEMRRIAKLIHLVLSGIEPFRVTAGIGKIVRGKIDYGLMREVRAEAAKLTGAKAAEGEAFEVRGERARIFLEHAGAADLISLKPGEARRSAFFDARGNLVEEAEVLRLQPGDPGRDRYHVRGSADLRDWLTAVSDGYVSIDPKDAYSKAHGPVAISPAEPREIPGIGPAEVESSKTFFVGQRTMEQRETAKQRAVFEFKAPEGKTRRTALFTEHKKLGAHMLPFAGYLMPGWYGPVAREHEAVRKGAGLFDVGHMGTLDITGPLCAEFIDALTTNFVVRLDPGQSQYNYILDVDGRVMDDVIVYRMARDRFIMVVNAANQDKIWQWLNAVNERRCVIDRDAPEKVAPGPVQLRRLKNPKHGSDCRIDLAFQGPASREVVGSLLGETERRGLEALNKFNHFECDLQGMSLIVSRTGYTGAVMGYEILVHPNDAVRLWNLLLEKGKKLGVLPTGLGARDSTRTEAGYPLYGHELAGDLDVIPSEAGYGSFVKRHKPFFAGKAPLVAKEEKQKRSIVRFRMKKSGIKAIRPGDPVFTGKDNKVGVVTSTVLVGKTQIGLACIKRKYRHDGTELAIGLLSRRGKPDLKAPMQREPAVVLPRFASFE